MTKTKRFIIGGIVAGALMLTSCAAPAPEATPTPTGTAQATRPLALPTASSGNDTASLKSQQEAAALAEQLMPQFLNHALPYDQWWAAVSPSMTVEARYMWQDTDPKAIRGSAVTGSAVVTSAPSSTQVVVEVPSDAGMWRLELIRQAEEGAAPGRWQVFALTSPPRTRK
jgi:hypothetical protein